MRILLISTFTLALYGGAADGQQPAPQPAAERSEQSQSRTETGQRRGHARHNSAQSDEGAPAPAGLPVSETIVNQTAPDPDPDR
jgi:hypothetical protein